MATLNGTNPNGPWSIFVRDVVVKDSGRIANGWSLSLRILHVATGAPATPPQILAETARMLPDGHFELTVRGEVGCVWEIWASDDLANWILLGTVTNSNGSVAITDPSANPTRRFYRVRQLP